MIRPWAPGPQCPHNENGPTKPAMLLPATGSGLQAGLGQPLVMGARAWTSAGRESKLSNKLEPTRPDPTWPVSTLDAGT